MNPSTEPVCHLDSLLPERPVAALVEGRQVAVVRLHDDRVVAVGMWDPFARANVMARGLVGSSLVDGEDVPVLFSPMYKQAFDLRTGVCLSDPGKALGTWEVTVLDGRVFVGEQLSAEAPLRHAEAGLAKAG
ncbi:nitrite reductase small subunit NirD [Tessaracoccus flavus]|uniref:nitrite reductase small subunit NirD n=1 Tax=Tessaracoccus flavus TaxID=1610493 RepID=UPI00089952D7|nr:nitrite reductase small subunit NirD [Tessaracoccus flavus]SDY51859.1 nitrite reductase (NADH) small subunit [Tessaracoccus flavus]